MARPGYTGRGGHVNRPLRYSVKRTVKISKDADQTLDEMAIVKATTKMVLLRRAIMKDIYIYKAEKKRREDAAGWPLLGEEEDDSDVLPADRD